MKVNVGSRNGGRQEIMLLERGRGQRWKHTGIFERFRGQIWQNLMMDWIE